MMSWDESDHPRDESGKFADSGAGEVISEFSKTTKDLKATLGRQAELENTLRSLQWQGKNSSDEYKSAAKEYNKVVRKRRELEKRHGSLKAKVDIISRHLNKRS